MDRKGRALEIAIIGGTGVYDPRILSNIRDEKVQTPYGEVTLKSGEYRGREIGFLQRHGEGHALPPHKINYRANIWALKKLGVRNVFATSAVGSLNKLMKPGDYVLLDQFIDFTKSRVYTFFEGGKAGVVHVDYTEPYCLELRALLKRAADELEIRAHDRGCYVCTEGPRFETPAEIKMFENLGGDLVGMTNVPEVVLAREAELCYSVIAMVTNWAAGISRTSLTHEEVLEIMAANSENMKRLLMKAVELLPENRDCACQHALHGTASIFDV